MRTIYKNAVIATMDYNSPFCSAMVTEDNIIIYAGTNDMAETYESPDTKSIDMGGKFIMPGFNDSHMHYLHYVKSKLSVDLTGTRSIDEIVEKMKKKTEGFDNSKGFFIVGEGWNQDYFTEETKKFPSADDLDRVSNEIPVIALRTCFHIGTLNHKAMEVLGIDKNTALKAGDFAETDENGEPNGIVKENFLEEIKTRIPYPDLSDLFDMVISSQTDLFGKGITSIQTDDMKYAPKGRNFEYLDMLRNAAEKGVLKVRYSEQALAESKDELNELLSYKDLKSENDHFKISTVKLISDGSLGARTAFLKEDYSDKKGTRGLSIYTQEELDNFIVTSNKSGMPVAVHAIGNGAMEMCLNSFELSKKEGTDSSLRNGIVHCQITDKGQFKRFKKLNLNAFTQPIFIDYDMHIVYNRVGKKLAETSYAWKNYLDMGIHESFGTDCPVERFDPLPGIYCAVTRKDTKGNGPYLQSEAVSVYDALYCYSAAGSYANNTENSVGLIAKGFFADFIVLDKDITKVPYDEIMNINVLETYIDGKQVYRKK